MEVGWFQFGNKNYANAHLSVTDQNRYDGRNVYGYVQATYKYTSWRIGPGHVYIPSFFTRYGTYEQSGVTNTSWRGMVGSDFKPTPHYKKGIIVGVCQEINWAPDNCNSIYRESAQ